MRNEYKNFRSEFCSHYPLLIKAVQSTKGTVIELGTGVFSTPLLHWLCLNRFLISCESHPEYIEFSKQYESDNHEIVLVKDWEKEEFNKKYSVVFIDHTPTPRKRGDDAMRFTEAELVVLHDTGRHEDKYGYEKVFPLFKYRYDKNNTTVLSNYIDVTKWDN
jgi:hypothetical protein